MKKILFLVSIVLQLFQLSEAQSIQRVANGIWKISYGTLEKHLPTEFKAAPANAALNKMQTISTPPFISSNRISQASVNVKLCF